MKTANKGRKKCGVCRLKGYTMSMFPYHKLFVNNSMICMHCLIQKRNDILVVHVSKKNEKTNTL